MNLDKKFYFQLSDGQEWFVPLSEANGWNPWTYRRIDEKITLPRQAWQPAATENYKMVAPNREQTASWSGWLASPVSSCLLWSYAPVRPDNGESEQLQAIIVLDTEIDFKAGSEQFQLLFVAVEAEREHQGRGLDHVGMDVQVSAEANMVFKLHSSMKE